jgi:hypothetical protein
MSSAPLDRFRLAFATAIVVIATLATAAGPAHAATARAVHEIRHVFVIVLENESASTTFGATSPAPYLSHRLRAEGAYLPNYYGVGHHSLDNYIAMISGQAPNTQTDDDCPIFADFPSDATGADGQQEGTGCVYPADIPTIASQLTKAGDRKPTRSCARGCRRSPGRPYSDRTVC